MAWRSGVQRARDDVDMRLERIVHRWQPTAGSMVDRDDHPPDDRGHGLGDGLGDGLDDESRARIMVGPWNRPALRALVVMAGALALIVGYLAWQSRPREVVAATEVIAVGDPLAGLEESEAITSPPLGSTSPPLGSSAPLAEPTATGSPGEVVVHVAGLVQRPGLVRLPAGSRVADAVEAVGGITGKRAMDSINLARVLVDGEQILVTNTPSGGSPAGVGNPSSSTVVDLNTATRDQLDALPGVGPVLADRILAWRTSQGRFTSVDELGEVSGIGDAILAQLRPLVRV